MEDIKRVMQFEGAGRVIFDIELEDNEEQLHLHFKDHKELINILNKAMEKDYEFIIGSKNPFINYLEVSNIVIKDILITNLN